MIKFCTKLMPKVLRIYTCEDWSVDGNFDTFYDILNEFQTRDDKFIILFSNPVEKPGEISFPPVSILMSIIAKLFSVRGSLEDAVLCNIIHIQDKNARMNINRVLQYYTPVNTTHIVDTKQEAVDIINQL